jgi:hypothetical protein
MLLPFCVVLWLLFLFYIHIYIKYFLILPTQLSVSFFLFSCFSNDGKDGGEYYNKQHSNSTTINSNCRDNNKKKIEMK